MTGKTNVMRKKIFWGSQKSNKLELPNNWRFTYNRYALSLHLQRVNPADNYQIKATNKDSRMAWLTSSCCLFGPEAVSEILWIWFCQSCHLQRLFLKIGSLLCQIVSMKLGLGKDKKVTKPFSPNLFISFVSTLFSMTPVLPNDSFAFWRKIHITLKIG